MRGVCSLVDKPSGCSSAILDYTQNDGRGSRKDRKCEATSHTHTHTSLDLELFFLVKNQRASRRKLYSILKKRMATLHIWGVQGRCDSINVLSNLILFYLQLDLEPCSSSFCGGWSQKSKRRVDS